MKTLIALWIALTVAGLLIGCGKTPEIRFTPVSNNSFIMFDQKLGRACWSGVRSGNPIADLYKNESHPSVDLQLCYAPDTLEPKADSSASAPDPWAQYVVTPKAQSTEPPTVLKHPYDATHRQPAIGESIDCYNGFKLLPADGAAFGGVLTGCGPGMYPRPQSERANLPPAELQHVERIEACQKRAGADPNDTPTKFKACRDVQ